MSDVLAVSVQDDNQQIPLRLASLFGWVELVRVLLHRGETANSMDILGRTPLHQVAGSKYYHSRLLATLNQVRITKLLLEHGAVVNAQDHDNTTPLHIASYYGKVDIVKVLLDCGAPSN